MSNPEVLVAVAESNGGLESVETLLDNSNLSEIEDEDTLTAIQERFKTLIEEKVDNQYTK